MPLQYAETIQKMTLEEKASLCSGHDYWHSEGVPSAGIPSIMLTDGPHGIRKRAEKTSEQRHSILKGAPAICYPTASATACSWDTDLLYKMGQALGDECLKERISVLLGPGVNIKRSPLCGRNFEYFSEDPVLAGEMAAAFINGVQSKGIGTSIKHYAVNNQETRRMTVNAVVDERTLRELYLAPFERAIKKAQPWTVMCAYNRLNGVYCAENKWLLTDVLRRDFGFEGIVVTDWGAENDRVEGLLAGQELEMPFSGGANDRKLAQAVRDGKISEEFLNQMVDRLIDLAQKSEKVLGDYTYDAAAHHALAREIAGQCMVLLKNEGGLLPLKKKQRVAVIGEMAKRPRYQGAGSSQINPTQLDCAYDTMVQEGIAVDYAPGYSTDRKNKISDDMFLSEAIAKAKGADVAVLFIGLTDEYETEGNDRKHMQLPPLHNRLVNEVSKVNPNVVVVLAGGAAFELPWADRVPAILHSHLCGQAGGSAAVDILFGDVNPCAKLAETYPMVLADVPSTHYFPGTAVSVEYREGIYVGYRYYDKANVGVRFPFGYGLSYTTFEYSDLALSAGSIKDTDTLTVSFQVKNTGGVDGAEIAQVYVADVDSTIYRAPKELKGFRKIFLKAGEEKTVSVTLDKRAFAYYNVALGDWHVESGAFKILVGASSRDIRLEGSVEVQSTVEAEIPDYRASAPSYYSGDLMHVPDAEFEAVLGHEIPPSVRDQRLPLTLTNTFEDAKNGKWGGRINRLMGKMLDPDSMAGALAVQSPIKLFIVDSMGVFSPEMAEGLLLILNEDKFAKGMGKILKGVPGALKRLPNLLKSL